MPLIKPGTICIWQNINPYSGYAHLEGEETTAMSGLKFMEAWHPTQGIIFGLFYMTDTLDPKDGNANLAASPHELRPKAEPDEDEMKDLMEVQDMQASL